MHELFKLFYAKILGRFSAILKPFTRLQLGFMGQAFGQGTQVLIRLIEVPLFLYFWGPQTYGEWLVVVAIPSLLTLSDLGISQSGVRGMTTANAAGQHEKALEIFQSSAAMTFLFSSCAALLFVTFAIFGNAGGTFGLSKTTSLNLTWLIVPLAAYTIVSMQSLMMFGVLQSIGRYPLGFFLLAISRILEFSFVVLVISTGGGMEGVALGMLAAQMSSFLCLLYFSRRNAPWMSMGVDRVNVSTIQSLFKPSFAFAAFPIAQAISLQVFRIIISGTIGPAAVVLFSAHRQLARFLNTISTFMMSVQGELGLTFGQGDLGDFQRLAVKGLQVLALVSVSAFIGLLLFSTFIFSFWTIGKISFDWTLFSILLTGALAETLWRGAMAPAMATNRHFRVAMMYLTIQIIGIPIVIGAAQLGLHQVALVASCAELLVFAFSIYDFLRVVQVQMGQLFHFHFPKGGL